MTAVRDAAEGRWEKRGKGRARKGTLRQDRLLRGTFGGVRFGESSLTADGSGERPVLERRGRDKPSSRTADQANTVRDGICQYAAAP
jgi:hypothetical protein